MKPLPRSVQNVPLEPFEAADRKNEDRLASFFSRPDKILIKLEQKPPSRLFHASPLTVCEGSRKAPDFLDYQHFSCPLSYAFFYRLLHPFITAAHARAHLRGNASYPGTRLYNPTTVRLGDLGLPSTRICGKQRGVKNTGSAPIRISPIFLIWTRRFSTGQLGRKPRNCLP